MDFQFLHPLYITTFGPPPLPPFFFFRLSFALVFTSSVQPIGSLHVGFSFEFGYYSWFSGSSPPSPLIPVSDSLPIAVSYLSPLLAVAMTDEDDANSPHLAALCQRLGRLCSPHNLEVWNEVPAPAKLDECRLTLIGKVFADSPVNFSAFQSFFQRIWRAEQVDISQREDSLYAAKFKLQKDKQRILDGGPWLFSGRLVVFKDWIPNTPLHCYDFSSCAIWVQVFGLPLEYYTEPLIRKAVMTVEKVLEVRADGHDTFTMQSGRVRVELDF